MQLVRRFRLPALFCALALLLCALLSRPYTTMGVSDDGPYIRVAQTLARTGHIVYNGWAAPILGWQLYLGAAFIRLFGYSLTAGRMSTLLVGVLMAFLLQRTLVRAGLREESAAFGTLALVLSPLYLQLSVTYMSDMFGLFAVVVCLYGCLRALGASADREAVLWICFAVAGNAVLGSARQIAWLGLLAMIPSTLYLLRRRRRVLQIGVLVNLAGVLFLLVCMHWFLRQPYNEHEPLIPAGFRVARAAEQLARLLLDVPFLLLPVFVLFLPEVRGARRLSPGALAAVLLGYLLFGAHLLHPHPLFVLEPTVDGTSWVTAYGFYNPVGASTPAVFLGSRLRLLLTVASGGGLVGLAISILRSRASGLRSSEARPPTGSPEAQPPTGGIDSRQLPVLLAPFVTAYLLLLLPLGTSTFGLFDRYLLPLLVFALLVVLRHYQECVRPQLPLAAWALIPVLAAYGTATTYNTFSLCRALVRLATQMRSAGVPDTAVDQGWDFDFYTELQHSNHINDPRIVLPAHAYVPVPPPTAGSCWAKEGFYYYVPHLHPLYGVSFDPNACYGPAPFAPVHFSRWPYRTPGTLYVVRYQPLQNP